MNYIIQEYDRSRKVMLYVCARPGFRLDAEGKQVRDFTDPWKSAPEMTKDRARALVFTSHRAAKRVANLCPSATVYAVHGSGIPFPQA